LQPLLDNRSPAAKLDGMALGTKNRQNETAQVCKQHLRETQRDKLALVEEFIVEIEGAGKNHDAARWLRFSDASWKNGEMLKRLEREFEAWLNPGK
jgi:hypothetical protein